jgi:hypothetical protein
LCRLIGQHLIKKKIIKDPYAQTEEEKKLVSIEIIRNLKIFKKPGMIYLIILELNGWNKVEFYE